ncbi:MAG: hypothetical protein JO079_03540 [Frankiaceae bacterium]|nr:hypothetical protein [Frankiaceae bacterium]MBV9369514.1 hypothetical protein [Frankiales bacterium]
MDPHAVLHPVGPHEPRVYWTRRAALLAAVLVVLILLVTYGCSGGNAHPAANRHPVTTPTVTHPPTAVPTTTPAPTGACTPAQLTVAASTDAATYAAGVLPHLTAMLRASGTASCQVAASALRWEIVSGSDTVYTTAGCPATSKTTYTVRPNHPVRIGRIWDRHRSVAGCASPGTSAGSGTYQLRVTVAGVRSPIAVFHLTG